MIPNLRDVGETVNIIYGDMVMKEGVLFRGGSVNELFDASELPPVNTILNLRTGSDRVFSGLNQIHIPAIDSVENYHTHHGQVRNWANRAMCSLGGEGIYPLLVHCTAGKDRTGVIIALILLSIGIDRDVIVEEYMQSQGVGNSQKIETAIAGIGKADQYIHDYSVITALQSALLVN